MATHVMPSIKPINTNEAQYVEDRTRRVLLPFLIALVLVLTIAATVDFKDSTETHTAPDRSVQVDPHNPLSQ